jgi:hypothetical protein
VSKATKRKPKATPVVAEAVAEKLAVNLFDTAIPEAVEPEVVEIVDAPEFSLEPIAETTIQPVAPVAELVVEPIAEPIVEAVVEPTITPVVEAIAPVSVQAAVEMATEPEELESVEMSFEVEEVYEYTYEGEEIPLEPTASTTSGRSETLEVAPTPVVVPAAPIDYGLDLSDAIAQIGMEIDRIGWTKKQGSAYLQQTYGKRTRAELTETELFCFLNYLKSMPAKLQPQLSQIPF